MFFLLLFLFNSIFCWKCGADQLKIKPGIIHPSMEEKRRRLNSNYNPIKIFADYSNLKTTNLVDSNTLEKIISLIEDTCKEFSKFIKVEHVNVQLSGQENFIKEQC